MRVAPIRMQKFDPPLISMKQSKSTQNLQEDKKSIEMIFPKQVVT